MKFWEALNSKFSILVLGFILTGVVGNFIAYHYQERQWNREKELEILGRRLDETQHVVEEVTIQMRKRFYAMQKVFWELESRRDASAKEEWSVYQAIKDDWNIKVYIYRNKLSRLIGEDLAYRLIGPENAVKKNEEEIHSSFVSAHNSLKKFLRYERNDVNRKKLEENALKSLRSLSTNIDRLTSDIFLQYLGDYGVLRDRFEVNGGGSNREIEATPAGARR